MRVGQRWAGAARWGMTAALAATAFVTSGNWPAMAAGAHPAVPVKGITAGDLILSLCFSSTVAEYTPDGKLVQALITASDGLQGPTGSAFDKHDNLYVTNFYGNNVFKRTPQGKISVFSDAKILGNGHKFNSSESIAISQDGTKMYISDANRNGPGGGINVLDAATGTGVGFFPLPSSNGSMSRKGNHNGKGESDWVGFDKNGTLFMTNENAHQGFMQVNMKTGDIVQPSYIPNIGAIVYAFGFDKNGNLWLAASTEIQEYSPQGKLLHTYFNPKFPLIEAFSAVFDPTATVFYVGDILTSRVYTYDLNGNLKHTFKVPFDQVCGISVYRGFLP